MDLVIQNASEQASDTEAASRYRDLATTGRSVDAETASEIAALAVPASTEKVSVATTAVIRRCTSLGYAPTESQLEQIRALFVQLFSSTTTTP